MEKGGEPLGADPANPEVAVVDVHAEPGTSGEGAVGGAIDDYPLDDQEPEDDEEEDDDDDDDEQYEEQDMEDLLEQEEKKDDPDFDDMIAQRVQAGNIKMKVRIWSSG